MISSGRIALVLRWDGRRVRSARIENSRPRAASILVGRKPDEAVALATRAFSLCARAQGIAARRAVDAALGLASRDSASAERAVAAETALEHLWRLLLDWPAALGFAPRPASLRQLHHQLAGPVVDGRDAATAIEAMLAETGSALQSSGRIPELVAAARRGGELGRLLAHAIERDEAGPSVESCALLTPEPATAWSARFGGQLPSAEFCRTPEIGGSPAETGALARHAGTPAVCRLRRAGYRVAARVAARLADLAELAGRLREPNAGAPRVDASSAGNGIGLARVDTARGVLLHGLRVDGDRIADYAIVAPTEWNFHPNGVFAVEACGLVGSNAADLLGRGQRLALALDPCVEWDLLIEGTEDA